MQPRTAHLVGSLPFSDEETAMRLALDTLGPRLATLPDPEVGRKTDVHPNGERLGWIQWMIERFEGNPAFEMVKVPRCDERTGLWVDYRSAARFRVDVPPHELRRHLDLGLVDYFESSYAIFRRLRGEYGIPDLRFQFGIPGALALALFGLGPWQAFRYRQAIDDQLVEECNRIRTLAGDDVILQIELPVEFGLVLQTPQPLRRAAARVVTGWISDFVGRLLPNTRVGVHACFGDLANRPYRRTDDTAPLVHFFKALLRTWPPRRPLEYIHIPLAMANEAPPLVEDFYRPLRMLSVPEETRIVAGMVHEAWDDEDHWNILSIVEEQLRRPVGVAASCGLGRRSPEVAMALMQRMARLTGVEHRGEKIAVVGE
jgi:hypothetical protein